MENTFDNNPIAQAITNKIKDLLGEDLLKSEIKAVIKDAHPNFPDHLFEEAFSEAFTTL